MWPRPQSLQSLLSSTLSIPLIFFGYSSTFVSFLSTNFMPKTICHMKQGKVNDTITTRYKGTQTVSQTSIYIFSIWLKWVYQTPYQRHLRNDHKYSFSRFYLTIIISEGNVKVSRLVTFQGQFRWSIAGKLDFLHQAESQGKGNKLIEFVLQNAGKIDR